MQEIQRRHVVIQDKQIADAIRSIESRNNMPAGALRAKLAADGIGLRTLVDQIRVQLGWLQVVRDQLGDQAEVSTSAVAERQHMLEQQPASRSTWSPRFSFRSTIHRPRRMRSVLPTR